MLAGTRAEIEAAGIASRDIAPLYESFMMTREEQNTIGFLPGWVNKGAVVPKHLWGKSEAHFLRARGESVPAGIEIDLRHQKGPEEIIPTMIVQFKRESPGNFGKNRVRLFRRKVGKGDIETIAEVRVETPDGRVGLRVRRVRLSDEPFVEAFGGRKLRTDQAVAELSDVLNLKESTVLELIWPTGSSNFKPAQLEKRIRALVFQGRA